MHYHSLGKIPQKRHTQFRKPDGSLYQEQLFSTEGFSDLYSLLYHCTPPTQIVQVDNPYSIAPQTIHDKQLKHRCLNGFRVNPEKDYLKSRKPVLVNNDCKIILSAPQESSSSYFFKNADADEVIFIHEGTGVLKSMYGQIRFSYGDYIVIPRGTIYQMHFDTSSNRLLIIESAGPITFPKRYRNGFGQLMEHSPFCERDIRKPTDLETNDMKGDYLLYIKKQDNIYPYHYLNHPFDVIGWDGFVYPFAFSIHDFEPITGRVHQPPPVHQTFDGHNFVICSFVPRLFDYHPLAIPAPYNHSNIDSDEVLYYVDGDFMSRKHVEKGMLTLHPGGIPHGPHPGTVEKSIGAKETRELAVMIDTFKPLLMTTNAVEIEDPDYYKSWLPEGSGNAGMQLNNITS
ncbi:MAG: homogentisate 1,2-dioxygenase [Saprospiraceae bacterium]|nr:homogentisate 1,2-dioxygenase [Saprospiraceae bacterium]MBK8451477.1 homogentisate 1,2-dioxygenase [Saprospiraceae bacterium]MBK9220944.1 homogentisate 1,2-dioxygenase [Saprospiraceae bacterium]MBK9722211.1 homogentisate 1,2-dioxygenase [Saprospiraceae bacterium]MBK9729232.1 homogentisate 1,2-dioxygenase [Saprospiraceae bacterium]